MSKLREAIADMRDQGLDLGIVFPKEAPFKSLFGPSQVQDHLAYDSASRLFPLPTFHDVFDGLRSLTEEDRNQLLKNLGLNDTILEGYRANCQKGYMDLYDRCSEAYLELKNLLTFFFLMFSHNDASMLADARQKLVPMFNAAVQRQLKLTLNNNQPSAEEINRNSSGLFGGIYLFIVVLYV